MSYVLMPLDWDYDNPEIGQYLAKYAKRGIYSPAAIELLVDYCGAFKLDKPLELIVQAIRDFKVSKWPIVKFGLFKGETWGELELIQEF